MLFFRRNRCQPLDTVLQYRNPKVIAHFIREHSLSRDAAELLFTETLKWLWLCESHHQDQESGPSDTVPRSLGIFPSMLWIDEMWHSFILCTREYQYFCENYLGDFIDHVPETDSGPEKSTPLAEIETMVRYVSRKLGPDTARVWFVELPQRFGSN